MKKATKQRAIPSNTIDESCSKERLPLYLFLTLKTILKKCINFVREFLLYIDYKCIFCFKQILKFRPFFEII